MPLAESRYDGHADWYEAWNGPNAEKHAPLVAELLGPGEGLCLDLGCGTGHYFDVIAATGRTVVGLDLSADQLRIARRRSRHVVRADAGVLSGLVIEYLAEPGDMPIPVSVVVRARKPASSADGVRQVPRR